MTGLKAPFGSAWNAPVLVKWSGLGFAALAGRGKGDFASPWVNGLVMPGAVIGKALVAACSARSCRLWTTCVTEGWGAVFADCAKSPRSALFCCKDVLGKSNALSEA